MNVFASLDPGLPALPGGADVKLNSAVVKNGTFAFNGTLATVLYGIQSIPQNFLVGPDGRIVAKNVRGEELGKRLAAVLPTASSQ